MFMRICTPSVFWVTRVNTVFITTGSTADHGDGILIKGSSPFTLTSLATPRHAGVSSQRTPSHFAESNARRLPPPSTTFESPLPSASKVLTFIMPESSVDLKVLYQQNRIGPDIFGFYRHEIVDLLGQDVGEIFFPVPSKSPKSLNVYPKAVENEKQMDPSKASSLFSNSIQDVVPDFKRELLKSSLRQSVKALTLEIDEMVDPVIRARNILSLLRSKKQHLPAEYPQDSDSLMPSRKKQRISSSDARTELFAVKNRDADHEPDVNEGLKFLLESEDSLKLEKTLTRHSDELDAVLNHMQEQLEELLEAVVSKCRSMTEQEKQRLCKLIQELPPKNLDRVVEIIQAHHGKSLDTPLDNDEIFVELQEQGNVSLWRLYFYVKAIENARKRSM